MAEAQLKVTLVRSRIGSKPKQKGTLRALGLGKIGSSNVLPDRPEIRGMLARVPHLVVTEPVVAESEHTPRRVRAAKAAAASATEETVDATP